MTDNEREFFVRLGQRIAEVRKEAGLTQVEVAGRLGVSQQTINGFERGRRRVAVSTLLDLARMLDCSVEDLVAADKAPRRTKRGPASKLQRQLEEIQQLPKAKQRFVIEMLDTVIAQARRAEAS